VSVKRNHLSLVVDEVLTEANAVSERRTKEATAIKVAEAMPRTEVARGLRALAADLRSNTDSITYADLARNV
jgi:hypothetical protein